MSEIKVRVKQDPGYKWPTEVTAWVGQDGELKVAVTELAYQCGLVEVVRGEDAGIADYGRERWLKEPTPRGEANG